MNVGGLPFSTTHSGFWLVVLLMVVTAGSTLALLRRAGVLWRPHGPPGRLPSARRA